MNRKIIYTEFLKLKALRDELFSLYEQDRCVPVSSLIARSILEDISLEESPYHFAGRMGWELEIVTTDTSFIDELAGCLARTSAGLWSATYKKELHLDVAGIRYLFQGAMLIESTLNDDYCLARLHLDNIHPMPL